ncbi:MAG: hypothetical protein ACRD36_03530, partial [Candidatus Acidiferrum sp.]
AYYRWQEAALRSKPAADAATGAEKLGNEFLELFRNGKVKPDEVLSANMLAVQLRLSANQDAYQELQALATLEAVTGGGFCAGFDTAP